MFLKIQFACRIKLPCGNINARTHRNSSFSSDTKNDWTQRFFDTLEHLRLRWLRPSVCRRYLQQSAAHVPLFHLFANHPTGARWEAPPPSRRLAADWSPKQPVVMRRSRPLAPPRNFGSNVFLPVPLQPLPSCACLLSLPSSLPPARPPASRHQHISAALPSPLASAFISLRSQDL